MRRNAVLLSVILVLAWSSATTAQVKVPQDGRPLVSAGSAATPACLTRTAPSGSLVERLRSLKGGPSKVVKQGVWFARSLVDDTVARAHLGDLVYGDGTRSRQEIQQIRSMALEGVRTGVPGREVQRQFNNQVDVVLHRLARDARIEAGAPPCKVSVVGFGSLGRAELCPYSDLDFGILVEKPEAIAWARRFAGAFGKRLKQLGETKRFGDRGLASCVALSPEGSQQEVMVGTPEQFADYFRQPEERTRKIREIAYDARSIYGSAQLTNSMRGSIRKTMLDERFGAVRDGFVRSQLFGLPTINAAKTELDIKRDFMRGYQLPVIGLAAAWGLTATATHDRLDEAVAKGLMDKNLAEAVKAAASFGAGVRFRRHLEAGAESDKVRLDAQEAQEFAKHARTLTRFTALYRELAANPGVNPFARP